MSNDFFERHPGLKEKEITRVSAYGDCLQGYHYTLDEFKGELPAYQDTDYGTEFPDHEKVFVALDIDATQLDKEIVRAAITKYYPLCDGAYPDEDCRGCKIRKELGL